MEPIPELAESPPEGTVETLEGAGLRVERRARVWWVSDLTKARALIAAGITPPDPPTPPQVELEQVLRAMVLGGFMTRNEALVTARNGSIPAGIATPLLAGLDATQTFHVNIAWGCREWFRRDHRLWRLMVQQGVLTRQQVDAIFRAAVALD